MDYNSTREKLIIPEYGRNVQKMIYKALTIEDREKRTSFVKYIVGVMTQMHISNGSYGDYNHMIWDHLHIIADYKMDVDSPYAKPDKEAVEAKPKIIKYSTARIKYKPYGLNIEKMIKLAIDYEEGEEKTSLIENIANHLKKAYINWNRESVGDDVIIKHLAVLSDGKLTLNDDFKFISTEDLVAQSNKKKWVDNRGSARSGSRSTNRQNNRGKQNPKRKQFR
ncbi:MAG: DUF4290 domain-containing protein [Bacteroidales bacterium]|jgi:hypothetical protein|nr:DUF4290 domain-containing protein [Bacteroidales bacterium]